MKSLTILFTIIALNLMALPAEASDAKHWSQHKDWYYDTAPSLPISSLQAITSSTSHKGVMLGYYCYTTREVCAFGLYVDGINFFKSDNPYTFKAQVDDDKIYTISGMRPNSTGTTLLIQRHIDFDRALILGSKVKFKITAVDSDGTNEDEYITFSLKGSKVAVQHAARNFLADLDNKNDGFIESTGFATPSSF